MFTIHCAANIVGKNNLPAKTSRQAFYALIIGGAVMLGITGCGQKGALYLADTSSQTVTNSSEVLDSTSNPQDAAFAGIDDDDYEKTRYLEKMLADVKADPNDY
jgi:predicted small lipoprotein YifL